MSEQPAQQQTLFPELSNRAVAALAANAVRRLPDGAVGHLQQARKLSKVIRAQRADPVARQATGQAICMHLLAVLEAEEEAARPH